MAHNLLFIISGLERGGTEMRLLDLARLLPDELHTHICVTDNKLSMLAEFAKTRAQIYILPTAKPYLEPRTIRQFLSYVRQNEIEMVGSFDLKGLVLSTIAKMLCKANVRTVHHFVDLLHNYNSWQKSILWGLLRLVDSVVCNSEVIRNEIVDDHLPSEIVHVIRNGVDSERFSPFTGEERANCRAVLGYVESEFVLGTIANFRPEKNYPFLINSFRTLLESHPRLRLICVGGGPLLKAVKRSVQADNLEKKVSFTGYVDDVGVYLGAMDAFCLCSSQDGFPNTVLQAMSSGLPVICSAVGETRDVVDHGRSGLLFGANDSEQFRGTVSMVVEDKHLRESLSEAARITIENRFTLERMVKLYSDFYLCSSADSI